HDGAHRRGAIAELSAGELRANWIRRGQSAPDSFAPACFIIAAALSTIAFGVAWIRSTSAASARRNRGRRDERIYRSSALRARSGMNGTPLRSRRGALPPSE